MIDIRLQQLSDWLEFTLENDKLDITVASADASFRRYFRVKSLNKTWIAMDAPPEKEDCKPFIKVATAFRHLGVNVPEIYAQDLSRGFLLLADFGSICYLDKLTDETADQLYSDAMQTLLDLQTNPKAKSVNLPLYDADLLEREMHLFDEWFLAKHLAHKLSVDEQNILALTYQHLKESALSQPQAWVHRDYHSRNLMVVPDQNPGVIDFQDAVIGAVTYDLVSLLRDCYISWPPEKVEQWALQYLCMLKERNICTDVSNAQFIRWFDWMGIQRHLKAVGIFARLNYRDNKPTYLNDIPCTLDYIIAISAKYDELRDFHQFLIAVVATNSSSGK